MGVDANAVHELFAADDGPVTDLLRELAGRGADFSRALVPKRTGHMLDSITHGLSHDPADGQIQGWFGADTEAPIPFGRPWKGGFPIVSAMEAKDHFVWNRSPRGRPHTSGTRRTHPFLTDALTALEGEV